jgi:1,4-dihydroxy-6-naphthoate synthase
LTHITVYSSPDADDIFMMYGLMSGAVCRDDLNITVEFGDIEELNRKALAEALDVSAVSAHAMAYLADKYAVLSCGASFAGVDYGPILVVPSTSTHEFASLRAISSLKTIAIPGEMTTAALAFQIYLNENNLRPKLVPISFHDIHPAVLKGEVDAGILIHEGQILHQKLELKSLLNLGEWWWKTRNALLPLGLIAIRKGLGEELINKVAKLVKESIVFGHEHRMDALEFAKEYRRGLSIQELDKYVNMYANELSIDMGKNGFESVTMLIQGAINCGRLKTNPNISFIQS